MSSQNIKVKVETEVIVLKTVCDCCGKSGIERKEGVFRLSGFRIMTDGWVTGIDGVTASIQQESFDYCEECFRDVMRVISNVKDENFNAEE